MATTENNVARNLNLWSFIEKAKATKSVSFKVLQQFVLSLNQQELRHLIECYLKLKLASHKFSGSTVKQSVERLANNTIHHNHKTDQRILFKMNKKYGNKYTKKIIKRIQQHKTHKTNTKHIFSISPQVLSYSFQYLSFKELTKIQSVCSYFTYLRSKYQGLCHYYIHLDKKFFSKAMRSRMNLRYLTKFKHINIAAVYHGNSKWNNTPDKSVANRTKLFVDILNIIINKSLSCLETLEIDVTALIGRYKLAKGFSILHHILSEFCSLPITKLIWNNDTFSMLNQNKTEEMLIGIQHKLMTNCRNLKQVSFEQNATYRIGWNSAFFNPSSLFTKHIFIPIITRSYSKQLQSLSIHCPSFNVYNTNWDIIKLIAMNLKNIQRLSITSFVDTTTGINMDDIGIKHICLEELRTEFVITTNDFIGNVVIGHKIEETLYRLFSVFIGIKHFSFSFSTGFTHTPFEFDIDWKRVFGELFRNKRMFSVFNCVSCLETLEFEQVSLKAMQCALKHLMLLKDETYFNLKRLSVNIIETQSIMTYGHFRDFINQYLIPFIVCGACVDVSHFELCYGGAIKVRHRTYAGLWRESFQKNRFCIEVKKSYLEPIVNLLSNVPKTLRSFVLKMPPFTTNYGEKEKIKQVESVKLVQKLCGMITEKELSPSKLESIVFERLIISRKANDFLRFMFGFNNKFCYRDRKYHLHF